ncbi:MAG: hypothetical protein K2H09_01510 [Treponemataceae bacterium]|nr:hypothetical protein [Treponemataceae bacterium]
MEIGTAVAVNGVLYTPLRLLGKGKGGYSYRAARNGAPEGEAPVVLKQIHHEPCDYYTFGNKIEAERADYSRLVRVGIAMPRLIDVDAASERIVKEFIDGPTAAELAAAGRIDGGLLEQARRMSRLCRAAGLNIDWYPTNFIVQDGVLYYIDYECNEFKEEWSFETWGGRYWTPSAAPA